MSKRSGGAATAESASGAILRMARGNVRTNVTGELSNKIKFILDRPLSQCYNASDEQRRS